MLGKALCVKQCPEKLFEQSICATNSDYRTCPRAQTPTKPCKIKPNLIFIYRLKQILHSNWQELKCSAFKQSSKWRFGKIHDWLKHLLVGIPRTWWDLSCARIRLSSLTTLVRQANHLSIHGINNCTHGGRRFLCIFPRQQIWLRGQYTPGNARHGDLALDTCRTLLNHSNVLLVKDLTWSSSYRSH